MSGGTVAGTFKAMGTDCWAHRHRDLVPLEVHHIWPKGDHGPDVPENRITICSNAHSSVHDLLAKMLKAPDGRVLWPVRRRYGVRVRALALAGFTAIRTGQVVRPE